MISLRTIIAIILVIILVVAFAIGFWVQKYQKRFGFIPVTPKSIQGFPLYDTPSGNLDIGFYEITAHGPRAHLASTITATTTNPDGYYPVVQGTQAHIIGLQYVFYDATGKALGTSTNQAFTTQLKTKNASLPQIMVPIQ